jgi:hypothetical protein
LNRSVAKPHESTKFVFEKIKKKKRNLLANTLSILRVINFYQE